MNSIQTSEPELEIIKFLYQFKDDNKYYKLDGSILNIASEKERNFSIYTLRDNALIATDSEVSFNSMQQVVVNNFSNSEEIKAKILPKGILAVENLLQNTLDYCQ